MKDFQMVLLANGGLYSMFGIIAIVQFFRNCRSHRTWTTQKQVHLLALLGCAGMESTDCNFPHVTYGAFAAA
jgi:hypothetical protein